MKWSVKSALLTFSAFSLIAGPPTLKALGCATDLKSVSNQPHESTWEKYWKAHHLDMKKNAQRTRTPSTADTTTWSQDRPWGGKDSSLWKPEAIIANAASDALARGFAQTNAQEVLVSIPVKMLYGNVRPYGDGQTNASVTLGSYRGTYPPLVASWISFSDGTKTLNVRFVQAGGLSSTGQVTLDFANGSKPVNLGIAQSVQDGLFEINWKATQVQWGDLYQNHVAYLQLPGKPEWYPLDFRDAVKSTTELLSNVPEGQRNLGKGTLLDPEKASSQSTNAAVSSVSPFKRMYPKNPTPACKDGCPAGPNDFAGDLHATRFSPIMGVHNEFSNPDGSSIFTAVGNGDTTVILQPNTPFKMAYICFDGRNTTAESQLGVPSGGGWHEIGDDAETVMNTLENASPLFGYANGQPGDNRNYAFGLTDVTVLRKLRPGTALVTAAGTTTAAEDIDQRGKGAANGRNYHWFAFDVPDEVCAVEWVHNCIPSAANHIGLVCSE